MRNLNLSDVQINNSVMSYNGFSKIYNYNLDINKFSGKRMHGVERECVIKPYVAGILPYDSKRDQIVLIEQFRVGALADKHSPWLLELVAGIVDKEGESVAKMAERELAEETALTTNKLNFIMEYWVSPGASTEQLSLYWADVDSSKAGKICGVLAEQEDIKVHILSSDEAFDLMDKGLIANSLTIIGLQWLKLNREEIKKKVV